MRNETQKETRRHDRAALLEDLELAQLRLAFHEMDEQLADTAEKALADNPDMRQQAAAGESGVMRRIDRRLRAVEQREIRRVLLPVLHIAACALVVLFVGFALGAGVHFTWFQGWQTEDDQVYLLEGKALAVGPWADASDENAELEIYRLYTYEDVCDLLGFAPPLPDWAPEGWQLYEYYLSRIHGKITINAAYLQEGDPHFLHYQITYIADMESYLNGIFRTARAHGPRFRTVGRST